MSILVTGGAAYIGSHTVSALRGLGHEVIVLDSLELGVAESVIDAPLIVGTSVTTSSSRAPCTAPPRAGARHRDRRHRARERLRRNQADGRKDSAPVRHDRRVTRSEPALIQLCGRQLRPTHRRGLDLEHHLIPLVMKAVLLGDRGLEIFGDDYDTSDGACVRDYIHVDDLYDIIRTAYDWHRSQLYPVDGGDAAQWWRLPKGGAFLDTMTSRRFRGVCPETVSPRHWPVAPSRMPVTAMASPILDAMCCA